MRRAFLLVALCYCAKKTEPDLGVLSQPAVVTGRDGGASVQVGARVLWLFGDTLMTVTGADGFNYRSATAAWAAPRSLSVDDVLDSHGAPLQLFPYTDVEATYNRANGPTERYALWPGSAIVAPDGSGAWIFYQQLRVHPQALDYDYLSVGLARLASESTVATRDPAPLFSAPLPSFVLAAVVSDGNVYLYSCTAVPNALDSECEVVRAPVNQAPVPSAWQVWDGTAWNSNLLSGAVILHGPPGDLSVSFNAHLGKFLAVYSGIFSNDVFWRTAPAPQGPWSAPNELFTAKAPASGNDYAGKEHPEWASGAQIVVSVARPTGEFSGELRLTSLPLTDK